MRNHCKLCDWSTSTDEEMNEEQGRAAINHFLATGHPIGSDRQNQEQQSDSNDYSKRDIGR